jgi:hypothetical protein
LWLNSIRAIRAACDFAGAVRRAGAAFPAFKRARICLSASLLCAAGCSHLDSGFYPIGIYSVSKPGDLATVRQAGFNAVAGPAEASYLNAARTNGLKVLASPGTSAGLRFDAAAARRRVKAFDSHPALWAWYLVDEPDLNLIAPEAVIRANRFLKNIPAHKPTALAIYNGASAIDYANITDQMMIDHYPIPRLPLASFPQQVRMTRLAVGKKKPLIAVIQAFDWSCAPELVAGEKNLRPPTFDELRCMTYCALVRGVNGLFYYCFDDGRWKIREHPEVWDALKSVIAEVNSRNALFRAERIWWPGVVDYPNPADRFNAALDSAIASVMFRVRLNQSAIRPGYYMVAVNTTGRQIRCRFSAPGNLADRVPVLDENRLLPNQGRWLEDVFAPFAVHVYGPMPLR